MFFLFWCGSIRFDVVRSFHPQVLQLLFLLLTGTVIFPLLEAWLESRDDIRRTWIMYDNVVVSAEVLLLFLTVA